VLAVHALVEGEAHLWMSDPGEAFRVLPGDIVLVQEATPHHLAHAPGAACIPLESAFDDGSGVSRSATVGEPGDGAATSFFCGAYRFEGDLCHGLIGALPNSLRLRPTAGSTLRATMDLLAREMLHDEPGQQTLLDRLLDVALVQILREHFNDRTSTAPGWFTASGDRRIGEALRAVHEDPRRQWTVGDMAALAALSRSAFARRFSELVGVAPLTYLHDWRMALARERLRDTDARLAEIAGSLGYASEFSFAAAFKRHHGSAPGRWRAEARAQAAPLPAATAR
jgi:AraC-like DNA-binding protein